MMLALALVTAAAVLAYRFLVRGARRSRPTAATRGSTAMFNHPDYDGHESVLFAHDAATGLRRSWPSTAPLLGPAFGGCRMRPYPDEAQALADVSASPGA